MEKELRVVLTREEIINKVKELGEIISHDYMENNLVLISVLRGSVYFAVDLSRCLSIPFSIDFISISRYGERTDSTGVVRITKDLDLNIADKNVLIIEDIVDTGLSLSYLLRNLKTRNPADLKVCTFLNVEARRIVNVPVHYKGFDLPDIFVVGYGLDYDEEYRNLQFIAEMKKT
ncbi:MAG: hypoxanthine phosphoribosyltransferase [Firmicutes bacterium HGW-Firmicutes-13]|nr:MAG: hypoxanthine phosphoribosyltransferase [Firmicutes bacterium HGW-Firmicutes-13]